MLREQALENAAQVEKAYGAVIGAFTNANIRQCSSSSVEEEAEWGGINRSSPSEHNKEYEDEEVFATVTIVEDLDLHGPAPSPVVRQTRSTPIHNIKKAKQKKIRYETKDARRREQIKQRARRTEKAELAGGKASRTHRGRKGQHGFKR